MSTRVSSIPVTVDPNFKFTTREQALDLDKAFDEAFGGPLHDVELATPKKEVEAPPAEEPESKPEIEPEPPAPATKEEPEPKKPEPEPQPATTDKQVPEADPDDEPDEELDKFRIHPDSRPETVHVVRMFRGMVKQRNKQVKELQEELTREREQLKQLNGTVRPVSDPTVQAELENLRTFQQKHRIYDDSIYQTNYEQPVHQIFDDIVKDVVALANNKEEAQSWEKQVRAAGPDRLEHSYWSEGVIAQCQDPLHRERLVHKISGLLHAQNIRNQFRDSMANDSQAYDQFRTQQAADYWQNFSVEAEDEAKKVIPSLGEWATPKELTMAKNDAERKAWEAHNKTHGEYEARFKEFLTDAATQGPRGMTRVAIAAVTGEKAKRDLDVANKQIAKLQAELKGAQEEINKIAGARSRINSSSGTSTASKAVDGKSKIRQSVGDAFREHFGTT